MKRCACPKILDARFMVVSWCALLKIIAFVKHGAAGLFKLTSPKSLICSESERLWQMERRTPPSGSLDILCLFSGVIYSNDSFY
jgi:hypothetical protein